MTVRPIVMIAENRFCAAWPLKNAASMQIDAGAITQARVGGSVALPISIENSSAVGRPLFVTGLWSREKGGDWREEDLGWEKIQAGRSRPAMISANEIERSGVHSMQVLLTLASRWRWRQECFAFSANITLNIEDDTSSTGPVVNIGGESAGHGNTVYISNKSDPESKQLASDAAHGLDLVRAEKEERRLGLRGLDERSWVPRKTRLEWRGFGDKHIPADGPILSSDGILAAGRSRARGEGGLGDIRILIKDNNGQFDEDLSRMISRRHFELYVECDRLVLRVNGSGGIRVNGEAYGPGKIIGIGDGDIIAPLVTAEAALAIKTDFKAEHGRVNIIQFSRLPGFDGG